MIKARSGNTIILGLSDENMKRLSRNGANQPIKFNLKDLDLEDDIDVVIFNGETEESMYTEMLDLIGPKTKLK